MNNEEFKNSSLYKKYLEENPKVGYLKIRAYAASSAVPIENLDIIVSKKIDDNNVIFFKGKTNSSGIIEKITLPTKTLVNDNLAPLGTEYDIEASYNNLKNTFKVMIYDNVYVVQNINVIPNMNGRIGDTNGY